MRDIRIFLSLAGKVPTGKAPVNDAGKRHGRLGGPLGPMGADDLMRDLGDAIPAI
jgi:hypothetical protein